MRGAMDHYSKAHHLFGNIRGYRRFCDMHYSLARFERSEVAKQRLRIIEFYKRYGERATKEAFGVDRRLVSRWRRRLADAGGDLLSTRPHRVRRSDVAQQFVDFIRSLREEHPILSEVRQSVSQPAPCTDPSGCE